MTWHQRYCLRKYIRDSIWLLPVLGIVVALATARLVDLISMGKEPASHLYPDAVRNVLGTLASSMFTCIIFAFSTLLLAVQLASAQLTPRIIAIVFRDPITKLTLTVLVFVFTFSLAVLLRIGSSVPMLPVKLAVYGCLVSLCLFILLIDHIVKFLRPSGVLRSVARTGHRIIENVFPRHLTKLPPVPLAPDVSLNGEPAYTVTNRSNGVILALGVPELAALAERFDCIIVMLPQVGNFVAAGEPLFHIFHGGEKLPVNILSHSIAVGDERTFQQDPALAFRIIVDIACKALSPAINDPTTAVLAIDQIHHLLRNVGSRHLDEGLVRDTAGRLRLVYRTPDWEDFVRLAITEIRQYGAESIQVNRRLHAMLDNLIRTLPKERTAPLRQELKILQSMAKRSFPEPQDRIMAEVNDSQGVGGKAADELTKPAASSLRSKPAEK